MSQKPNVDRDVLMQHYLEAAEKAIDENELPEASVRIQAAKGILVKLGGKLK